MKRFLTYLILLLTACRLMALPEIQRDTCINAVHNWHVERVTSINTLTVPEEIKAEMIAYSTQDETTQLREICDIGRKTGYSTPAPSPSTVYRLPSTEQ